MGEKKDQINRELHFFFTVASAAFKQLNYVLLILVNIAESDVSWHICEMLFQIQFTCIKDKNQRLTRASGLLLKQSITISINLLKFKHQGGFS